MSVALVSAYGSPHQSGPFQLCHAHDTPPFLPHLLQHPVGAPILGSEHYRSALNWVRTNHPFWNSSNGADHMWVFPHDEGSCVAPIELQNSILISSWGRYTERPHNSTTTNGDQAWHFPLSLPRMYASRHCFERGKDIVMPVFTSISQLALSPYLTSATGTPALAKKLLFHFRGQILRNVPAYSMGIRQQLLAQYGCQTGSERTSAKALEGVPK